MNKELTETIFILDRSGSMGGLETDTIGGYNSFLKRQQKDPGISYITTVLFDDQYELLHNCIPVQEVPELTEKEYFTRGTTALLDAIGRTISTVARRLEDQTDQQKPRKVIMVITTDGYENSSQEYNLHQVRTMITKQKDKYNWEFIFLGADIAAEDIADSMGIARSSAVQYSKSSDGTLNMFNCMAENVSDLKTKGYLKNDWKEDMQK